MRSRRFLRYAGLALLTVVLLAIAGAGVYLTATFKLMAYQGDRVAYDYLHVSDIVAVDRENKYIFFDGPGEDIALVFYPGAAVEPEAYAPLMEMLAESGTDCYLMRMPINFPLLGIGMFNVVYEEGKYRKWLIGGHSLGGTAASCYAARPKADLDGIIFLASFPIRDLRDSGLSALSVTASEDGVIDRKNLAKYRQYLPEDTVEVEIQGGNHSGFGSYGEQDGDHRATIPKSQQWAETLLAINEFEAGLKGGDEAAGGAGS